MDSFELARLRAAALHDELVAAGADAMRPLALVRAAAARFSYELTFLEAVNAGVIPGQCGGVKVGQ